MPAPPQPPPGTDPGFDALIVGQGLAGSCLAWALAERGLTFRIVDPGPAPQPTSSRLAAGLVTPLTGPRLSPNWRFDDLLPVADAFYRRTCARLAGAGAPAASGFWQPIEIVRLLLDPGLRAAWDKRSRQPAARHVTRVLPAPTLLPEGAAAPHGALVMDGWRLDCPGWLEACRLHWISTGALIEARLDPADLDIKTTRVDWRGLSARTVVWCTGADLAQAPWFRDVPCRHQVGDVLRLAAMPSLGGRVVNGGAWLLADRDAGGQPVTRAGATYFDTTRPVPPPDEARTMLLAKLRRLGLDLPPVLAQQRATRPVIAGHKVVAGRLPAHPRVAWFNGLGSKGVLKAPHFALNLASHLAADTPIDPAAVWPPVEDGRP